MTRVAVQPGAAWLRVAAEGRVVAALPAPRAPLPDVLAGLFDTPPDELVVVTPAEGPAAVGAVATVPAAVGAVATVPAAVGAVATVPAAVAALAATGEATAVVVDVGHLGTEVAHVRSGRVGRARHVPAGGAALDAATVEALAGLGAAVSPAEARRVREALSLLPEVRAGTPPTVVAAGDLRGALAAVLDAVVEAVRVVVADGGPGPPPPVLLVGGVARGPLLAELLDDAGVAGVRVPARPDCAAVLGALRLPAEAMSVADTAARTAAAPPVVNAPPLVATPPPTWLPPVRPGRRRAARASFGAAVATVAAAALLTAGTALPEPAYPADELVQYGYGVRLPAGWAHTGGEPDRQRSLLTRSVAPDGTDLVAVERTPLGYDADAEPQRVRAELRAQFDLGVAAGKPLSGYDERARFAGRPVVAFHEAATATEGEVDWYVVLDGDSQFSIGCRHTPSGAAAVEAACATVVASLRRTG